MRRRPTMLLAAIAFLAIALALPVLAVKPDVAPGQAKEKVASVPITLAGTIQVSTDAEGEATYTLRDGGTTYTLEAGPRWFFGGEYPLDPYVGQDVIVEGEVAEGTREVDVRAINGVALRDAGKPPWAGGWKRVGAAHPGWSEAKAERFANRFGDGCWPPGHCKAGQNGKPAKPAKPEDARDPEKVGGPEVTDAPDVTVAPEVTHAPEVTDAPAVTHAPEITDAPDVTTAPASTEASEATSTP